MFLLVLRRATPGRAPLAIAWACITFAPIRLHLFITIIIVYFFIFVNRYLKFFLMVIFRLNWTNFRFFAPVYCKKIATLF
ncbi:hypothetical protein AM228_02480 [Planktothricoides sp. SR001]|nr:hypothetical protein AM228_02480 [Planktothricoides sp. SR001]